MKEETYRKLRKEEAYKELIDYVKYNYDDYDISWYTDIECRSEYILTALMPNNTTRKISISYDGMLITDIITK